MQIFLVGGAVRDQLLELPVKDKDWVVVGSSVEKMLDQGYTQVGADFPVFLHPKSKEEYALARTERKTAKGYKGFDCVSDDSVTLEDDLKRRDLTINAIAMDNKGNLFDPYGGLQDIKDKVLRHVSAAFIEDPLRILRLARFYARFEHLGFIVADETIQLMRNMVESGELATLVAERVWTDMQKALGEKNPESFFMILRQVGALKVVLPELDALYGVPQPMLYHPEVDCAIHSLKVLQIACTLSNDTNVRFASLLHDIGKGQSPRDNLPHHYGHEQSGEQIVKSLCKRLKLPNKTSQLCQLVAKYHTHTHRARELNSKTIHKVFQAFGAFKNNSLFEQFLICCESDARGRSGFTDSKYPQSQYLRDLLIQAKTITAKEFIEQGLIGEKIGIAIHKAQIQQIDKTRESISV
ncbi:MAG: multifunctional CCA addition/repair protein [Saccharospirillaceae bacterium]|nr:multifunctional CCA addition/repair protein [Pseudomonadales bacterium]NRB79768.1 multifunctional CCA addition/repair protein [Saccharospirillaceae bacterium]